MANTEKNPGDFVMIGRGDDSDVLAVVIDVGNVNENPEDRTLGVYPLVGGVFTQPGDGFGQWSDIQTIQPFTVTSDSESTGEPVDYSQMTVDELKQEIYSRDLAVPGGANKASLIGLLESTDE